MKHIAPDFVFCVLSKSSLSVLYLLSFCFKFCEIEESSLQFSSHTICIVHYVCKCRMCTILLVNGKIKSVLILEDIIWLFQWVIQSILLVFHFPIRTEHYYILQLTGRVEEKRRWSDGIHQAVEAKEGLKIQVNLFFWLLICEMFYQVSFGILGNFNKLQILWITRLIQWLWHKSHISHYLSCIPSSRGWLGQQRLR